MTEVSLPKNIKVAKVIDENRVVINKGSKDGVSRNQLFLVYELGDEIFDPDTKESLGKLENVKGTGRVISIQPKISVLEAVVKPPHMTSTLLKLGDIFNETYNTSTFYKAKEGDLVKLI
ncbi:MAG: hypothetical protein CMF60_05230 [Magnetococcales bacterium]|nr:hypothetical protein [Magnetococcales bacterium]|tara:strand:- start:8336 stop:8692 length:357 start_codon:yes stop_codon:yes gene_type:complete